jgi:hypothetical protein
MPFMKKGIAPVSIVKCGCGQTLSSISSSCPKCGKNLRPLSSPDALPPKPQPEDKPDTE